MTVAEMIQDLSEYPPDLHVFYAGYYDNYEVEIDGVEKDCGTKQDVLMLR